MDSTDHCCTWRTLFLPLAAVSTAQRTNKEEVPKAELKFALHIHPSAFSFEEEVFCMDQSRHSCRQIAAGKNAVDQQQLTFISKNLPPLLGCMVPLMSSSSKGV